MFDADSRVLVCVAHPDDETIGMGGTIHRVRQASGSVRIVFFGEGVTARYPLEKVNDPSVLAEIETRNANARKACGLLGVDESYLVFEERLCCRFDTVPQIDLVKAVEHHLNDFQPTHVFTHSDADTNVDHRCLNQAVLTAARPIRYPDIRLLAMFEVLSSTETNTLAPFAPDMFVDVAANMPAKIAALNAYGDEIGAVPHPRSPEAVEGLARFRGAQAAMAFAEAFKTARAIIR